MSIARHHAEWLSLVEVSGPFLSMPVLLEAFRDGLEAHDPDHHRLLRLAHDEWEAKPNNPATHNAWIRFVLRKTLDFAPEALLEGQAIPQTLHAEVAEQHEILKPDLVLKEPASDKARLLIQTYPATQELTKPVPGVAWKASPDTRMTELLHATGVRLGLVTNGERWMLVDAPRGETTGYASWYATLWLDEPITLRAFRSLLGLHRFFGVDEKETLEELLKKSAANQQEVTDQLGYQVRKAVEVLIQSLDRADQDHGRELLRGVSEAELYEAALTVMMRLVFLFCAEERELLLLGDPLYNQNYALSTIREQLRATADQFGEEVLERRHDAWCRLLVNFRAVHGGVWHDNMKLPAYGGRLFDPDRFPFLEGRKRETSWRNAEATPLPVNNRTVLHLLEALQVLQVKVPGGGPAEARRLSFRALDIEQIGHVYEGLLDHTAKRAGEPYLGLAGTKDQEPEIALKKLEELHGKGEKDFFRFLKDETGRSEAAFRKALKTEFDAQAVSRFRSACQGDEALWHRVQPFAGLVRLDTCGYPVVIPQGSVFVTAGTDRRLSGTHYTPRELTDPIVKYTLEPLVYVGPAEGLPKAEWKLKPAKELLDLKICDMACGSGAFLVQACRYLSERLLEAWERSEKEAQVGHQNTFFEKKDRTISTVRITPYGLASQGELYEQLVPLDLNERLTYARRIIAQRCLYGVDKNPLAVEMAKLSLWLLTLAKDKPFEFLDHAIRCGDSLVGISNLDQLKVFNLDPSQGRNLFTGPIFNLVDEAVALRQKIEAMPSNTVDDVEAQEKLLAEAEEKTARLRCAADLLLSVEFQGASAADKQSLHDSMGIQAGYYVENGTIEEFRQAVWKALKGQQTFHWALEFPEVFQKRGGFDAVVGNPPFMGGQKITGFLGEPYREYIVRHLANGKRGSADICAYFFIRGTQLLRTHGQLGSLATNTIAQGDTRDVGLAQLLEGSCVIPRAVRSHPWPGVASLEIALVWVRKGKWASLFVLDDQPTNGITAFLTAPGTITGDPYRLKANEDKSFQGCIVLGMGFVLTPEEAVRFIEKDTRNKDVLFPYLNGEDLNSRPDQSPSRWVINFFDWPIQKAMQYPDCFRIIEEKVKAERMRNNRKERREKWWQYAEKAPALYRTIAGMERVLVRSRIANLHSMCWVPGKWVYNEKTVVFTGCPFALMQSSVHEAWARAYSSTLRTDMQYTPSDCFETFPFPTKLAGLDAIGDVYHEHRRQIMFARQEGLTKTYNRFHDPDEISTDIQKLRQLHIEMDQAVAAAYGWADLDLGHDFGVTKQGLRYTISELARREVLARLLRLNHERYAEEVKQGLHEKTRRPVAGGKQKSKKATPALVAKGLFDVDGVDTAFPSTDREKLLCGLLCDLVADQPRLPTTAYLDALVIALRPSRHGRLLVGGDRTQFTALSERLFKGTVLTGGIIPWTDVVEVLSQLGAVRKAGAALEKGSRIQDVRALYPACDAKLIGLIHKAAATLREYQNPDAAGSPDGEEIIKEVNESRLELFGVAA